MEYSISHLSRWNWTPMARRLLSRHLAASSAAPFETWSKLVESESRNARQYEEAVVRMLRRNAHHNAYRAIPRLSPALHASIGLTERTE